MLTRLSTGGRAMAERSTCRTACASGAELWTWLKGRAFLRLRRRQAHGQDVETALIEIVAMHGGK